MNTGPHVIQFRFVESLMFPADGWYMATIRGDPYQNVGVGKTPIAAMAMLEKQMVRS